MAIGVNWAEIWDATIWDTAIWSQTASTSGTSIFVISTSVNIETLSTSVDA